MRLALVPIVSVNEPGLGMISRPDLPSSVEGRWGQASSKWRSQGQVLVWLDVDETEALNLAKDGVTIIDDYVEWTRQDHAAMLTPSLRTEEFLDADAEEVAKRGTELWLPAWEEKHRILREISASSLAVVKQCRLAYRAVAKRFEDEWFRPLEGIVAALSVVSSDGFSGTSASLSGRTMDAALGGAANTWGLSGSIAVGSGVATGSGGGNYGYDATASAVDIQRATVKTLTDVNVGCTVRYIDNSSNYFGWRNGSNQAQIYITNGGPSALSTNGTFSDNDTMALDADGDQLTLLKNGSAQVGPVTDATWATGVGGIRVDTASLDDFVYEVDSGASSQIKTVNGVAIANVKTWNGVAIASIKTFNGVANS
jgi:hypothetical protein